MRRHPFPPGWSPRVASVPLGGQIQFRIQIRRRVAAEPQQPEAAAAGVRLICGVRRERPIGFVRLKASARLRLRVSELLHALAVMHGLDLDTCVANGLVWACSFDAMVGEGLEPGGAALASVPSVCARSGGLEMGRRVHELLVERGMAFCSCFQICAHMLLPAVASPRWRG